jgi:hypothetical protein
MEVDSDRTVPGIRPAGRWFEPTNGLTQNDNMGCDTGDSFDYLRKWTVTEPSPVSARQVGGSNQPMDLLKMTTWVATPRDSSDYPRKWTVAEPSPVSAWWIMQDLYCEKRINGWKGMEGYSIIIKNLRSISEGAELT